MSRPKITKTRSDKTYDSLAQAASALHIPKWILSAAKARGCDAFNGSRVNAASLRRWLEKHGSELGSNLSPVQSAILRRIQLQCERIEFDLAIERRDYLPRADVNEAIDTANGIVRREILQSVESQLPPMLEQRPASEIQKTLRRTFGEIFRDLPRAFKAPVNSPNGNSQKMQLEKTHQ